MALTAATMAGLKKKLPTTLDTNMRTFMCTFIDALGAQVDADGAATAITASGATGSVTAGSSSEALTVVDGIITDIA